MKDLQQLTPMSKPTYPSRVISAAEPPKSEAWWNSALKISGGHRGHHIVMKNDGWAVSYHNSLKVWRRGFATADTARRALIKARCLLEQPGPAAVSAPTVLHPLVEHLLRGDIDEMPLSVLGDDCPSHDRYQLLDPEQLARLQAAATVSAWLDGKLHRSGYLHDPQHHSLHDLIPPVVSTR